MTSRLKFSTSAFLLGVSFGGSAFADVPPESAESLFVRARTAMKSGDCTTALPLLERSHALEPAAGTRFNLAICEARLGKLTQAAEHLRAVIEASPPGNDRRAHAERALEELLPRIPRLVIEIDERIHTVEGVELDGEAVQGLRANEPFSINPGAHEIEVVLTGHAPQSRRFTVADRQVYTWSLGGGAVATTQTPPPRDAKDGDTPPAAPDERPFVWTTQRTAAVVAGGASLAAFGIGTGFALSARSVYDTSKGDCSTDDACNVEGIEERDRAREHGRIATVAFTVGISAAFAAGVLWFTGAPRGPDSEASLQVGATWAGIGSRGESVGIIVKGDYD